MTTERSDIYTRITNRIIEAIEEGAGSYRMPWHCTDSGAFSPYNVATKKPYRGINILSLWADAQAKGFESGIWGTYKQWEAIGAQVRKGEKSSLVVFWKFGNTEREDDADSAEDQAASDSTRRLIFARGYSVFNAGQVDGFEIPALPAFNAEERNQEAEQFFQAVPATIRHGGNSAHYSPSSDHIQMPRFEAFKDAKGYYSVLSHELTHWTGASTRLNRDLTCRFGTEAYAMEELVAELGAAFLCGSLGIQLDPRTDHAPYLKSWLNVLKGDTKAVFTAASKAQAAVDWMAEIAAKQPSNAVSCGLVA